MSPSLAIYILAVGSLISSLASFPETTNLALKESPISKYLTDFSVGPAATNLRASLSSLAEATGYLTIVNYADSLCKTPLYAGTILLNNCQQTAEDVYYYYTATSSTWGMGVYSDSQCKVALNATVVPYLYDVCFNKTRLSITSTDKWTTDLSTFLMR
jgi:hypothetical protein